MSSLVFHGGTVILEDRLLTGARVEVDGPRITAIRTDPGSDGIDLGGGYLAPGFVDLHVHGVGLLPDRPALASSVVGLDHCVRTFHRLTGVPLEVAVRMASLTPARIAGWDHDLGSIAPGKRADLVVLDRDLNVRQVYRDGQLLWDAEWV